MSFGEFLLYSFSVLIWVAVVCAWVFALVDLFGRQDLSGWAKAIWLVVILILPLLGMLIYFVTRPEYVPGPGEARRTAATPAEQLQMLAELRDAGKITEADFQAEKMRLLGQAPGQGTAVPNP